MDTTGRQRRTRRRIRGKSDFAAFDEIALFSDALTGDELAPGRTPAAAERLLLLKLLGAWSRAVGPHLKAVAWPASCREGRLTVEVRDAGWKRELERARPEIHSRLARLMPDQPIREIAFRLKSVLPEGSTATVARRDTAAAPAPPLARPAGRAVLDAAQPLRPGPACDLSDQLRQVMGRYLSRSH